MEFMKEVIHWVNKTAIENKISELVIVSDSHIYGLIKPLLTHQLLPKLQHVTKNLGKVKIVPAKLHEVIGL